MKATPAFSTANRATTSTLASCLPVQYLSPKFEGLHTRAPAHFYDYAPRPFVWMANQLEAIFGELGITQYLDIFVDQGFDTWETILDITESDLLVCPLDPSLCCRLLPVLTRVPAKRCIGCQAWPPQGKRHSRDSPIIIASVLTVMHRSSSGALPTSEVSPSRLRSCLRRHQPVTSRK